MLDRCRPSLVPAVGHDECRHHVGIDDEVDAGRRELVERTGRMRLHRLDCLGGEIAADEDARNVEGHVRRKVPPKLGLQHAVVGWQHDADLVPNAAHVFARSVCLSRHAREKAPAWLGCDERAILSDDFAAQDGHCRSTLQGLSFERRARRPRANDFGRDVERRLRIDQHEVSVGTDRETALAVSKPEEFRRSLGEQGRDPRVVDDLSCREIERSRREGI